MFDPVLVHESTFSTESPETAAASGLSLVRAAGLECPADYIEVWFFQVSICPFRSM